jgi:hypothetical protein
VGNLGWLVTSVQFHIAYPDLNPDCILHLNPPGERDEWRIRLPRHPAPIPPDNRFDLSSFLDTVEHYAFRISATFLLLSWIVRHLWHDLHG